MKKNICKWFKMKAGFKIIFYTFFFASIFVIEIYSQNFQVDNQLRLAKTFETRGNYEEAESIYTELHNNNPKHFQYYQSLYNVLITQKKYQQALELTENQIKISKNIVSLYGDLGSVYFILGKEKEALKYWEEALEIESDNPFAYRTIANYLIENRLTEEAIDVLIRGNQVSKDDNTIFSYDIGNLYSLTMKFEEATKEYCRILIQKPTQINIVNNRIAQYINSNQASEPTFKVIEETYKETENIVFLQLLSDLYLRTDNGEKAFPVIIEIENKTSNNGSAIFAFARKVSLQSNFETAAKAYKYILENYENSAIFSEAEIGYTRSLEENLNRKNSDKFSWKPLVIQKNENISEFTDLIKTYRNIAEKYPENNIGWEAEFRTGIILFENLKDYNKADSIFKKIIDDGKSIQFLDEANFYLAKISLKKGNLDLAENYLAKVSKSGRAKTELRNKGNFLYAKTIMWKGEFSNSIEFFNKVIENPKDDYVNDALQYILILNTFKNDSTNLFSFVNADYLVEKNNFNAAEVEFKKLAENKDLFLLKDFAALNYINLLIALNNYEEAVIFLEEVSNCDEDNIYKDRFLYLLGSNYYYGLKNENKALEPLTRIFENFPNSIYYNKARKIISEINEGVNRNL
ncbi:MAG: tetratricopeptide repeat protein [Ignavibacteriales bacterium]|nr:tetratricopeptide repeat protein [Ignavibacteriales bacterium]